MREIDSSACYLANTDGPVNLANLSAKYNFKLLTFSSDLVFDGSQTSAYMENDLVSPHSVYGRSKMLAEKHVLEKDSSALIIRTSAFFGPWDEYNFVSHVLSSLKNQQFVKAESDVLVSPTYVPDLVNTSLDLLLDNEFGIWHLANQGQITWAEMAISIARQAGLDTNLIIPTPLHNFNYRAKRPLFSSLGTLKGNLMPPLHNAFDRYFEEQKIHSNLTDVVIKIKAG